MRCPRASAPGARCSWRRPTRADVDALVARGYVGISLPATALATPAALERVGPLLERLEHHDAPLFVHPGPVADARASSLPPWWPALTDYVAQMQAAWLAFLHAGRRAHPRLRVLFAMLAGGAPLQLERLAARGGPAGAVHDPLLFYDTSSYGPRALRAADRRRRRRTARARLRPPGRRGGRAAGRHGARPRAAAREPEPPADLPLGTRTDGGMSALTGIDRPLGRDLDGDELLTVATQVAARPELWSAHVQHDPEQRTYAQLLRDAHLDLWLICWSHDHDTGYHDHDLSAGAVAVIAGSVREERLVLGRPARAPIARTVRAGSSFAFGASDIHRVLHAGDAPAVTIHAYSPPLVRMGAYAIEPSGQLRRHAISYEEELRPLETVRG